MNRDFQRVVLKAFDEIIKKFDFKVELPYWDEIRLINDKCIIYIIFDSGYVAVNLIDPKEKAEREKIKREDGLPPGFPKYPAYWVWEFLYPNDKEDFRYPGLDLEGQALAMKRLITQRLENVVKGDFSWTDAIKENEIRG